MKRIFLIFIAAVAFYNRVWPKNHPFWQHNQPGNLWNCKCDWEQTDDPPTDGNPTNNAAANGLEGNPATTGEVFTDSCSYVANAEGYNAVNAFCRDRLIEIAKTTSKTAKADFGGIEKDVIINKIGLKETAGKRFGNPDFWLKNYIAEHIDEFLPQASYIGAEEIDLTHNSKKGEAYKTKKQMKQAHKFNICINNKVFQITIFEYKNSGDMLFYYIEP